MQVGMPFQDHRQHPTQLQGAPQKDQPSRKSSSDTSTLASLISDAPVAAPGGPTTFSSRLVPIRTAAAAAASASVLNRSLLPITSSSSDSIPTAAAATTTANRCNLQLTLLLKRNWTGNRIRSP
mmetsp:Transcript_1756/g.2354  ORF Transcript_1756/g.2354 Transcript_1756/m.2354 type:complete len:124 (+) Transcript_1756:46-417(+)